MHCTSEHCQPKIAQLRLLIVPDLIDRNGQRNLCSTPTFMSTLPKRESDQNTGHAAESRQLPLVLMNFSAPSRRNESARKAGHNREVEQTHRMSTWSAASKMLVEEQRQNGRKCDSLNWHLLPFSCWHLDHTQQTHRQGTKRPSCKTSSLGSCHAAKLQI